MDTELIEIYSPSLKTWEFRAVIYKESSYYVQKEWMGYLDVLVIKCEDSMLPAKCVISWLPHSLLQEYCMYFIVKDHKLKGCILKCPAH